MVLGKQHFAGLIGQQRTAFESCIAARQPQRGIHHMQIIIQQREIKIVWPDAIATMFIHS